jgi:hypothetical protein
VQQGFKPSCISQLEFFFFVQVGFDLTGVLQTIGTTDQPSVQTLQR